MFKQLLRKSINFIKVSDRQKFSHCRGVPKVFLGLTPPWLVKKIFYLKGIKHGLDDQKGGVFGAKIPDLAPKEKFQLKTG